MKKTIKIGSSMDLGDSPSSTPFLSSLQIHNLFQFLAASISSIRFGLLLLMIMSPKQINAFEGLKDDKPHLEKFGRDLDNSIYHTHVPERTPTFAGPIQNVTVNVGREAVLECPVIALGQYKVGWLKAKDQTILALHTRVITHNARVGVDHEEHRIWKLKIRHIQESDRGCYMCQLNTEEMKKQIGCIDVLIPPDIDDRQTSSDVIVNEGDDADLVCKANGHPKPSIEWFREDKNHINVVELKMNQSRRLTVDKYTGEILRLKKVQRQQMGAYLCIASNNVPPAVSKRIILNVNFAPEIMVPSQLFGVAPGTEVTFSCNVQAYPPSINYWMKNESEMLLNGGPKYNISEVQVSSYERRMYITIKNWQKIDESHYSCIATNSLGKADGRIQTYTYTAKEEPEEKLLDVSPQPQELPNPEIQTEKKDLGHIDVKIILDFDQKTNENRKRNDYMKSKKNTASSKSINSAYANSPGSSKDNNSNILITFITVLSSTIIWSHHLKLF